jgi:hypothetical protein
MNTDLNANDENTLSTWKYQSAELRNMVKTARTAGVTVSPPADAVLQPCQFCDRSFLPDRLIVHHRSCTAFHPARKVSDPINPLKTLEITGRGVGSCSRMKDCPQKMMSEVPVCSSYNINFQLYPHAFDKLEPATLAQCQCCARTFLPDRLKVHIESCSAMYPARSVGEPMRGRVRGRISAFTSGHQTYKNNWKEWSSGFRSFIAASKAVEAQAHPSMTECPTCHKRFNEMAAMRHIPGCESVSKFNMKMRSNMNKSKHGGKWRADSQHFRECVREARQLAATGREHIEHWKGVHSASPVPVC